MSKLSLESVSVLSAVRWERPFLSFFFLFLRFLLPLIIELFVSVLVLRCFHFVFFFSPYIFSPTFFPPASDKLLLAWREMEHAVELCGRVGDAF